MAIDVARTFRSILLVLSTAFVSVIGTLLAATTIEWSKPEVPLTSGLMARGDPAALASDRFDLRVRQRFPVGSEEHAMATELLREGFGQSDFGGVTGAEHQAFRDSPRAFILDTATIFWRSDAAGRIVAIRGVYTVTGP